ncbi:MAG: DMT family transporter [Bacteroidales bacterium]|nr:DMT family transporter [Bacteroidales bacterium]MCF8458159.1 DMT family transporter [Bacteroidales bacterium]
MKNQTKAYIYALSAVLFWSTIATAFSLALKELDSFQLMTGASFVAVICLATILSFQRKLGFLRKLKVNDLLHSALLGFLNPFLYYVVLLKAYTILPAQEAMALNYVWPISLVLLSVVILKQKIGWKSLAAIGVSFCGVILIGTRGQLLDFALTDWLGDLLALSSSVVWALFWIFNMKDKRDESEKLFLNFFFGFIYLLIGTFLFSSFTMPGTKGLIAVAYIGLFELGITFFLWLKALTLSSSTDKVSQLVFLSPFLSLLFINLIVKEPILPSTILGLVLIIAGILFQQKIGRRRR